MRRYLLVALWPAGLAAIAAATIVAARRAPLPAAAGTTDDLESQGEPAPADAGHGGRNAPAAEAGPAREQAYGLRARAAGQLLPETPDWVPGLIRLGAISAAGGVGAYAVMTLIGVPIVKHGPDIDEPIFRWTNDNQVRPWAAVLERLNRVGNTWTTWGASGAAAACLGVTWPRQKWLPPAALGAAIVVDHYATLALRHRFNRLGPPSSPLGTYPAGGPDRVILFYGLIAHMLWREFSGSQRGKIWAIGSVSALAFHQAYCREYLSKHWFTDIVSGLLYGGVLLAPFITAIRMIAGPADVKAGHGGPAPRTLVSSGATQHGGAGLPQDLQVEYE
jgi:hypothetical protein